MSRRGNPTLSPTAVDAFKVDGKVVGVPFEVGEVAFYYNKKLFEKAGVKAEDIKTWDDFLGAVKKLKAAGITPIVVGAGEKWPMHFYYSYLVMRIGGEHALADAKAGKDGGFKNATFVEAGKRLRELAALEPFQPGYLSTKHAESAGMFGDGKAAMDLMGQWLLGMQGPNSTSGKGWPPRTSASCRSRSFRAARARRPTRSAASTAGSSASPPRPRRSTSSNSSARRNTRRRPRRRPPISRSSRARKARSPIRSFKRLADDLAKTTYHQNYFDQDLGPSVGRVINDVSVAVAAGQMTPEAAAAAIQEAADQQ